jgi:hypothetical protein
MLTGIPGAQTSARRPRLTQAACIAGGVRLASGQTAGCALLATICPSLAGVWHAC